MGVYRRDYTSGTYYGNITQSGGANLLKDGSDTTYIDVGESSFFTPDGYFNLVYPTFVGAGTEIPAGRSVVGVRMVHRFGQPSTSYRGWPYTYIRQNGARLAASDILQPDGYQQNVWRTQTGPVAYKAGNQAWTATDINQMDSFTGLVPPAYEVSNRKYRVSEVWMEIIYSEVLTVPTVPSPANAAVVSTSNVPLSYQAPAPQAEQTVRVIFDVARDSGFTSDKRTYVGAYHNGTGTARGSYTGVAGTATDTNLGPGVWYMRGKTQDILGTETAWSTTTSFTVTHAALPVPVNTTPAPGSISINPYMVRGARVDTAASDNRAVGMEFNWATNTGFTTNLRTKLIPASPIPPAVATTGTVSYDPTGDSAQRLIQGTQYVRSRTVDKWGQTSAWSTTDSFSVQHQPVAQNVSPTGSAVIDQTVTPVRWTFGDPWLGDAQTAYQIKVYDPSNVLVYDSGKIASTALQHIMAISGTYLYQVLRYTVSLWDTDDVTSAALSSYYFTFSNSPAITMSFPAANEAIATGQPTFRWNPGISRPGVTQKSFELKVYNTVTGNLIHTSGVVNSTAISYTPPTTILSNGGSYQLTLRIVDTDNLNSTLTRNFTASYQAPTSATLVVDPLLYLESGYVNLDWGLTVPDDYFINWNVYRRRFGDTAWTLISSIDDSSTTTYHDWEVPKVGEFQYTVTQVADRFGYILESALDEIAPPYYIRSEDFWLIDPDDEANNIRLYSVTENPWTDVFEKSSYVVKGRGRRVNYGTHVGIEGTLTIKVRPNSGYTPTELIEQIQACMERRRWMKMRDPFGRITQVAFGDMSSTPMAGTGENEFADVQIPYEQVF